MNECNTKEEVLAVELDYDSVEYVKPSFEDQTVNEVADE